MACIVLGLEYCHSNNVIHRDIKPENLVLDYQGYVKVTDFGIAKYYERDNASETSGTPGYMAPEVMCSQNHSFEVDYYALGIIGYEFMNGLRPYMGKTRKEIKEKILSRQAQIKKGEMQKGWSLEAADCINRLLQRKPSRRLGFGGATEVKENSWFKFYPWKDLYLGKVESPFIPRQGDNYDYKYCNKPERIGLNTKERYIAIMGGTQYALVFKDFENFNRETEKASETKSEKFKNPHEVYYQNNEGCSIEKDSTILNRKILDNTIKEDMYSESVKSSKVTLFKLYYNNNNVRSNRNNYYSMNNSRSSKKNDMTLNSSYASRKYFPIKIIKQNS